jgi:hypothetical protein
MSHVQDYRKKPVVIQALYWDASTTDEMLDAIQDFLGDTKWFIDGEPMQGLYIKTLEGTMRSEVPCYIIKGVRKEFYICEESIFNETYEEA